MPYSSSASRSSKSGFRMLNSGMLGPAVHPSFISALVKKNTLGMEKLEKPLWDWDLFALFAQQHLINRLHTSVCSTPTKGFDCSTNSSYSRVISWHLRTSNSAK